jgi:MHS family alpha-ketoglutarate permease-like MFS transporter
MTTRERLRAILGGSAGHLVEWYDWFAYSSFALYFADAFFPKGDQTAQLLQSAAVFAIGFLARPIGAWAMGLYADRAGRRPALALSVAMMCLGSFVIAVTPGFAEIGMAAPSILLAARVLQGLSVGGEYGASATYISEIAGRAGRGFWSSFLYVTLIGGQLIALCVLLLLQNVMSTEALQAWGWRIPFAIGGVMAIVVYWIRTGISESASFKNRRGEPARTIQLFRDHPREVLMVLGLTAGGALSFYAYTTYMQKFLVNTSGFTKDEAAEVTALALVCFMLAQPVFGWLSDRFGRKPMLVAAFGLNTALAYPLFSAIEAAREVADVQVLVLAPLLILSAYTSISAVVKAELFPAHIRALGVALPFSLANAIFGGTAEYSALWFKQAGLEHGFYIYVTGVSAIALAAAVCMRDTKHESLIRED